ncbi:MAG TPA: WD40 repeat domain-containing protein, partial [Blastocatellia bacterium]|nr:WD40 repeat domain-containing protein [Blastocatellia bacterium]
LYWTGGHPYLSQRLCSAVAEDPAVTQHEGVDRTCIELFVSDRARITNDNLTFVRDRLLRSEVDPAALLEMYRAIRCNRRVRDDKGNPLASALLLSGIARSLDGYLVMRNRIYRRAFDHAWIKANMPDAERRRQRAAFHRGLLRAAGFAALILAVVLGLAITAIRGYRQAEKQRKVAEDEGRSRRRLLYDAQMNLAQREWESGHVGRVLDLLEAERPKPSEEDLRGFEWYYLWRLCHGDLAAFRHSSPVNSVAFSPDGKILATGTQDSAVTLWDVASRKQAGRLVGHTESVNSVAFSPDGRILASASSDRTVKLWEVRRRQQMTTLTGHQNAVQAVTFSPDGKLLATAGADGTVKLWDLARGEEFRTLRDRTGAVYAVAFSPDSRILATGSKTALKLWQIATGRELAELNEKNAEVYSVLFSPNASTILEVSHDAVVLWDLASRRKLDIIKTYNGPVMTSALSPDGRFLATGGQDGQVHLRDVATKKDVAVYKGHKDTVRCVAFSPTGQVLASGSSDGTAKLWDVTRPPKDSVTLLGHTDEILSVAVSPDDRYVATGSNDMTAKLWDVATGHDLRTLKGSGISVWSLGFSSDGKMLAAGSNEVELWDTTTGKRVSTLTEGVFEAHSVAFTPDSKLLATGDADRRVKLWDIEGAKQLATLTGHTGPVDALAFSNDGDLLASGNGMETKLWDVHSGNEIQTTGGHESLLNSVARYPVYPDPPGLPFILVGVDDAVPDRYIGRGPEGRASPVYGRTSIQRSKGWHKLEVTIDDAGYQILIDRALAASGVGKFGFTDVSLEVTGPPWRHRTSYYFDDFCIASTDSRASFRDNFESAVLDSFWRVLQQYGTAELSSEQSHQGHQSLKLSPRRGGSYEIAVSHHFDQVNKGTVSVWFYDAAPGTETLYAKMVLYNNNVMVYSCAALSPDARMLATGRLDDNSVTVSDLRTGRELATLRGHAGQVTSLAFSPDGKRLITASDDRTIKLWDVATWQEVATFKGSTDTVNLVKFSKDGKILATATRDNVVRLWQAANDNRGHQ